MRKTLITMIILLSSAQLQSNTYNIKLDKKHYKNSILVEDIEVIVPDPVQLLVSPDETNVLTLNSITDSNHVLGAGWYLFDEGIQTNFTTLPQFGLLKNSNHSQFALYHSDNFHLTFNRSLLTRDGSNAHGQPYWNTSTANIINTGNLNVGSKVHYVNYYTVSGLVFSNVAGDPWCSPINGRYNGGCANGNYGIGDWKIYIK